MDISPEITSNLFVWTVLSSTLVATVVGFILNWIKEHFQKKGEREDKQFENLYGPVICIFAGFG